MQKIFLVMVAVVALLVLGFFALNSYIYNEKQADETEEEVEARGETGGQYETFVDEETGVSFEYKASADGYVIDDMSDAADTGPDGAKPVRIYTIMNAAEKAELEASAPGREGPPAMQVVVYENTDNQSASMWVDAFPQRSNLPLAIGEVDRDAVLGGANAVRYFADGLYVSENVVVAHGGYIYHFSGSFLERDSDIHNDFKLLLNTVTFVPTGDAMPAPASGGAKIDVRVACESALAYTLFESSEQADQFMAECVAGEHPDVIERYIESLGLDGATI